MRLQYAITPAGMCATPCPHKWQSDAGVKIRVGSSACEQCMYYGGPGSAELYEIICKREVGK